MREGPEASRPPNVAGGKIKPLWKFDTGKGYGSADVLLWPVVRDGHVYAAEPGGRVYALDTVTGRVVWETDLDLSLSSDPRSSADLWYAHQVKRPIREL